MKKSFVYLIIAVMLAAMLCGCGMEDGIIYDTPTPTEAVTPFPTLRPDTSHSTANDDGTLEVRPGENGPDTESGSMTSPMPSSSADKAAK